MPNRKKYPDLPPEEAERIADELCAEWSRAIERRRNLKLWRRGAPDHQVDRWLARDDQRLSRIADILRKSGDMPNARDLLPKEIIDALTDDAVARAEVLIRELGYGANARAVVMHRRKQWRRALELLHPLRPIEVYAGGINVSEWRRHEELYKAGERALQPVTLPKAQPRGALAPEQREVFDALARLHPDDHNPEPYARTEAAKIGSGGVWPPSLFSGNAVGRRSLSSQVWSEPSFAPVLVAYLSAVGMSEQEYLDHVYARGECGGEDESPAWSMPEIHHAFSYLEYSAHKLAMARAPAADGGDRLEWKHQVATAVTNALASDAAEIITSKEDKEPGVQDRAYAIVAEILSADESTVRRASRRARSAAQKKK